MALSDLSQGCSNKFDAVVINKNVTRLTTQGCNNTAIMNVLGLLEQPCKGRTIRYLWGGGGGGGWANTKKKFAHRKNPEKKYRKNNKPIEKKNRARTRGEF